MTRPTHPDEHREIRFREVAVRLAAVAVVTLALTGSAVASVDAAGQATDENRTQSTDSPFVVSLEPNGDATVSIVVRFDLTDVADRSAFQALQENETKRAALEARTERRFSAVADGASAETDREMTIEDTQVSFETTDGGDRGVVSISATWTGFAATDPDSDRLTIAEPLASGFTADQPFVLHLPEGYTLAQSTPSPSEQTDGRAVWDAGTSFEGYEAVIEPDAGSGTGTDSDKDDSQPGPGFLAFPAAIAGGVWLHRRR